MTRVCAMIAYLGLWFVGCVPLASKAPQRSKSEAADKGGIERRLVEIDLAISEWYSIQTYAGLDALVNWKLVEIGKAVSPTTVLENQRKLVEYASGNVRLQEAAEVQSAQKEWEKEQLAAADCLARVISKRERRAHLLSKGKNILAIQEYYLQLLQEERTALERQWAT